MVVILALRFMFSLSQGLTMNFDYILFLFNSHHCCVQLLLNGLIDILVTLIRVMDWEGLSEKQSGMCSHLKVWSLKNSNRNTLD